MRAVDRKDLELVARDATHPACRVYGLAIGGHRIRILKSSKTRLSLRELANLAKRHPGAIGSVPSAADRREKVLHNRYGQRRSHHSIEQNPQLREEPAPGNCSFIDHFKLLGTRVIGR